MSKTLRINLDLEIEEDFFKEQLLPIMKREELTFPEYVLYLLQQDAEAERNANYALEGS